MLHFFMSRLISDTVTSFAALQFLYFVFTLRRHFMLLNTSLNKVVMSTVKAECILPLKFYWRLQHMVLVLFCEEYKFLSSSYSIVIIYCPVMRT